jgi:hypothetical protein
MPSHDSNYRKSTSLCQSCGNGKGFFIGQGYRPSKTLAPREPKSLRPYSGAELRNVGGDSTFSLSIKEQVNGIGGSQ